MPSYKQRALALAPGLRCTREPDGVDKRFAYAIRHIQSQSRWGSTPQATWKKAYELLLDRHWAKALEL